MAEVEVEATFWKMASGTQFAGWSSKAKPLRRSHSPIMPKDEPRATACIYTVRAVLCVRGQKITVSVITP
jgi:hypothetical protein